MSPYIPIKRREEIQDGCTPQNAGELNYLITSIILEYLYNINPSEPNRYSDYNEVVGVLGCVTQELYRRKIIPYENLKRTENGDVF